MQMLYLFSQHTINFCNDQSDISYENIGESDIDDGIGWLPLDETFVGLRVPQLIHGLLEKGMITDSEVDRFLEAARSFYRESLRYRR